ncbi:MAG: YdiU family protein [Acidobacteriota bacterium]|nr:YdiU family protein [Acidobacteriota bacterium]
MSSASLHNVLGLAWDNSYARLPQRFFAPARPAIVAAPRLLAINDPLARELGMEPAALHTPDAIAIFAGNQIAPGSEPIALAYAGHQFGHFVPQLGDGRAILLGELITRSGARVDLQLKGSGRTAFSRRGDGRAAIGPVLREFLVSEAMHALGVPTTRALAAVATGETVLRERPVPGAVLTRVAASHIRVGTFEYFAAHQDVEALQLLASYAMARHYPQAREAEQPIRTFLELVLQRQARLIAQWLHVGFIHGVMNTDNMAISGETIDYGPCAFLDAYHPETVFSFIDQQGRYAYLQQPEIALWNLARFAETLLPLLERETGSQAAAVDAASRVLEGFATAFAAAHLEGLRAKLGLTTAQEEDAALAQDLLQAMAANQADYTSTFRLLAEAALGPQHEGALSALFRNPAEFSAWATRWRTRLQQEPADPTGRAQAMRCVNPAYIPRNHLVEAALAAAEHDNMAPFEALLQVIRHPFAEQPGREHYALPARPEQRVRHTFCGT